jgi:hypothetical protein
MQSSAKPLELFLRLHVNNIKAEPILLDDAVDAFVSVPANSGSRIAETTAVSHRHQQLHHDALEEAGRTFLEAGENV